MNNQNEAAPQYRPLGAWEYFGLSILYAIPVIGFIFLLVFTFSSGNINRRNYTRSYWCGLLVILLITLAFAGVMLVRQNDLSSVVKDPAGFFHSLTESITAPFRKGGTDSQITGAEDKAGAGAVSEADFKKTMDAYEAFFDEFIAFMDKFNSSEGSSEAMLSEYTEIIAKYAAYEKDMAQIDLNSLSDEEMQYYTAVTSRVEQKMAAFASKAG